MENNFLKFSFESISICHLKDATIECNLEQNIVVTDARIGHLPFLDKQNYNKTGWCHKSDQYYNISSEGCIKSVRKAISNRCTGKSNCDLHAIPSQYLSKEDMLCKAYNSYAIEMSLYVDYDCVLKELFFSPVQMNTIHFIGGYMTSVGYSTMKNNEMEEFKYLEQTFKTQKLLPFNIYFQPELVHDRPVSGTLFFQLQIIENSLSLSNQNFGDQTCQMGDLYLKDYYAFIPTNDTKTTTDKNQLTICNSNSDMVGQTFGPIFANFINIKINTNFTSFSKRALLIKFTTILCPFLVINNAKIVYDHVVHSDLEVTVSAIAIVTCNQGFFLLSMSNMTKKIFSKTLKCYQTSGLWNNTQTTEKCVNSLILPTMSPKLLSTKPVTITTSKPSKNDSFTTEVPPFLSSTIITTNISTVYIIIPETSTLSVRRNLEYYIIPVVLIFVFITLAFFFLLYKFRDKIFSKCPIRIFNWYFKLRFKNDSIPHTNYLAYPQTSMRHNFIFDDNIPMTESLNFTLSANGSCRQSNRTLITRTGSRPTIISGDSMQTSNYIFEPDNSEVSPGDELPTKLPKTSTLTRIMKSASSLRNNSLSRMRPKSLSRQSFLDRSSVLYDHRLSGSQIPLLLKIRPTNASQFMESNPVMCGSDIFQSKPLPKSAILLRKHHNARPYSHSDMQFQMNNKVVSPTIDTYLEPTDSFVQPYEISDERQTLSLKKEKSSDYMVYDHSQMSSNNPDTTCQSSIIASMSDGNANDEDERKRFSMISNHYYGLQGPNPRHSNGLFINTLNQGQYDFKSNSNESVYESIDDENMNLNTIDRRYIALPQPPTED